MNILALRTISLNGNVHVALAGVRRGGDLCPRRRLARLPIRVMILRG
jgi:hypothetical protein